MPLLANDQSAVLAPTQLLRLAWNSPRARTWGLLLKPISRMNNVVRNYT